MARQERLPDEVASLECNCDGRSTVGISLHLTESDSFGTGKRFRRRSSISLLREPNFTRCLSALLINRKTCVCVGFSTYKLWLLAIVPVSCHHHLHKLTTEENFRQVRPIWEDATMVDRAMQIRSHVCTSHDNQSTSLVWFSGRTLFHRGLATQEPLAIASVGDPLVYDGGWSN